MKARIIQTILNQKKGTAFIFGVVFIVCFYWELIFNHVLYLTPYVGTNDLLDLHIPFRHFLIESIKTYEFPHWSKDVSSGYPIYAEGQIGALYPLNLVSTFFPLLTSVKFTIISSYLLLFMYSFLYLRTIGFNQLGSLFGSLSIVFSGFSINQIMHWPILVSVYLFIAQTFFLEKKLRGGNWGWVVLTALFMGFSFLGGHPQINLYVLLAVAIYWLVFSWARKVHYFGVVSALVIYFVVSFGIGAVQLIPQYELVQNSTRAQGVAAVSIDRYSFDFVDLLTFVSPFANYDKSMTYETLLVNGWPRDEMYIYPGVVVVIFALIGIIFAKRNLYVYLFVAVLLASLILSFGTKLPPGYIFTVPPFNFFRIPFRIIFFANIAIAVLSAWGIQILVNKYRRFLSKKVLYVLVGLIFLISFVDWKHNSNMLYTKIDSRSWFETPQSVAYLKDNLEREQRITVEPYSMPFIKMFLTQPDSWYSGEGDKNLRNTLPIFNNLLYGIPSNVGVANSGGLKISRYNDLEMEIFFGGIDYDQSGKLLPNDSYLFLNRLMGVRYILSTQPVQTHITSAVYQTSPDPSHESIYVSEFLDYNPRVFMVPAVVYENDPQKIKSQILGIEFDPLSKIYVEEDIEELNSVSGLVATTNIISYQDNRVEIETQSSTDGFLYLSDTYYPGWKAIVCNKQNRDCRQEKIYRANYAFRAVHVPGGENRVIFFFQSDSFNLGLKITSVVLVISTVSILAFAMHRRGKFKTT